MVWPWSLGSGRGHVPGHSSPPGLNASTSSYGGLPSRIVRRSAGRTESAVYCGRLSLPLGRLPQRPVACLLDLGQLPLNLDGVAPVEDDVLVVSGRDVDQ
jgi:hypothetical protein